MDQPLKQDAWMEDALTSQSLAPMPSSVTLDVMKQIQSAQVKRPTLLTWSDIVVSAAIASCLAALWFAALHLPPILLAKLHIQGILLYQNLLVNLRWLIPDMMFGLAALLAAITIPTLFRMTMEHRR